MMKAKSNKKPETMDVVITRASFINGELVEPDVDKEGKPLKDKDRKPITLDYEDGRMLVACNKAREHKP